MQAVFIMIIIIRLCTYVGMFKINKFKGIFTHMYIIGYNTLYIDLGFYFYTK